MSIPFYQIILALVAGIAAILLLTIRFRIPAFFALLIACLVTGIGVGSSLPDTLTQMKEGFGNIMKSLSLIIILGTTLGVVLEQTGSTRVMANYILKKTGENRATLAMSITGFIVGLPLFSDSGYIVLSGLNHQLAKRTGISVIPMAISMATGLVSVHCLIPPHPGASAAAATINVDFGRLIGIGIIVAIPAMLIGHWWAVFSGKRNPHVSAGKLESIEDRRPGPGVIQSFLPVVLPIVLISIKSFLTLDQVNGSGWINGLMVLGDPIIALSIGILLAFIAKRDWDKNMVSFLLQESVEKGATILAIIGAGGMFGAVLAATRPGTHLSEMAGLRNLGLFFPFLLAVVLKTAQGSSTVAIITAASIIQPLLPGLGLTSDNARLLCVLSMGAGSMIISHANDAYFWVVSRFSGLDMKVVLRTYSLSTLWMGLISMLTIYILSFMLT